MASKPIAGAAAGTEVDAAPEPKHKYAQALGFAFPFFVGMAILWLFLRGDLERQYGQVMQQTSAQLNSVADTGISEIQSKILVVDSLLLDVRARGTAVSEEEFKSRVDNDLKRLGVISSKLSPRMTIVDLTGSRLLGSPLLEEEKKFFTVSVLDRLIASQTDRLFVEQGFSHGDTKKQTLLFARPLLGSGAAAKGAVLLTVDVGFLSPQKNRRLLFDKKIVSVTDIAGNVLWAADEAGIDISETKFKEIQNSESLVAAALKLNSAEKKGKLATHASRPSNSENGNAAVLGLLRSVLPGDGLERLYGWQFATEYGLYLFVGQRSSDALQPFSELRYRYVLFGVSLSILFVASLYWFFAFRHAAERSEIKQEAALELLRESENKLSASRRSLRQLVTHQMTLKEDERKKIALEIHDELGQRLTALRLEVAMAERRLTTEVDLSAIGALSNIKSQIDQVLEVVRNLATRLRPAILDISLGSAVVGLIQEFRKMTGLSVEFLDELPENFEPGEPYKTTVFRILQESLTNVARHANATTLSLRLGLEAESFVLEISDNGRGFNPDPIQHRGSMGLSGMSERAMALGGLVVIKSTPDGGTTVRLTLPLPEAVETRLQFISRESSLSDFRSE